MDRWLASPRFGERWGRHWLDMARYADSDGYEKDNPRPDAYRYRDWVIDAFNNDMPFDQFTIEQLAGDLLPEATDMQRLATAFHRQTLTNTEGGTDQEQFRVEACFDRTETTGTVWLGLTIGCARCHSHKYDQLSQREYYQLFAFFNNADETTRVVPKSVGEIREYELQQPEYERQVAELRAQLVKAQKDLEPAFQQWQIDALKDSKIPEKVAKILKKPAEDRTAAEQAALLEHYSRSAPATKGYMDKLDSLQKQAPAKQLTARVLVQRITSPRDTFVLRRGEFLEPLQDSRVSASGLATLPALNSRHGANASADRLDLAQWLVSADNPLTPRVTVNHVWKTLFGEGLVRTPNDFGVRGQAPTHPELLDWLAAEFIGRHTVARLSKPRERSAQAATTTAQDTTISTTQSQEPNDISTVHLPGPGRHSSN